MKNVILFIHHEGDDKPSFYDFDTVNEAKEYANLCVAPSYSMFTKLGEGQMKLEWKLMTDHATNLREAKKAEAEEVPKRGGEWTQLELDTLEKNFKAGMSMPDLSKALGRKYNSVYTKLKALGLI